MFRVSVGEYIKKLQKVGNFVKGRHSNFNDVISYLLSKNIDFILIGGLAVSHYSPPRFTEDVDILLENELELEKLKGVTSEVKWNRKHCFLFKGMEVEVLTPEFLSLPGVVNSYIFKTKVSQGDFLIPSVEGVLLLKLHSLRDKDKEDINSVVKTQGKTIDFDAVRNLTSKEGKDYLEKTIGNLQKYLDD